MNIIVKRIEEIRKKSGITKNALADKAGISRSSLGNWYYTDAYPSLPVIENICKALNITVEQFFYGMGNDKIEIEQQKFIDDWRMLTESEKAVIEKVFEAFRQLRQAKND